MVDHRLLQLIRAMEHVKEDFEARLVMGMPKWMWMISRTNEKRMLSLVE